MTYSRLSFFFVLIVFILSGFLSAQEQQDTTITITGEGDVGIGTTSPVSSSAFLKSATILSRFEDVASIGTRSLS